MDKNMNKLVSVLLPTYNGASRIQEAIQSVLDQSYANWELLVLDDGSLDNTKEIVDKLILGDRRIKYMKNEVNLGIQKTLNVGLHQGVGEYIARIDDDDVWIDRNKISKQVEFLEKNKDYVLVGTGFVAKDENNKEIYKLFNAEKDEDIRIKILNKNCFLHSSVVFQRGVALKFGGYSETEATKHIEDYDLWLKMGTVGKFANLPTYSVNFSLRTESISSKNKTIQFERCIHIIGKYKEYYPNYHWAFFNLSTRMFIYKFFQIKPFNYFYKYFYKLYKNI
ncbi:MAG: glycosyltransferase [Patescibacteria group bacterium]